MIIKSNPVDNPLRGTITLPGDKSISHRSLIIPSLSKGKSIISNLLESEDVLKTYNAMLNLGVKIEKKDNKIIIHGEGLDSLKKSNKEIYLGNSGTSARLLIGLLASQSFETKITGDKSLSNRPMNRIISPLEKMGGLFKSNNKKLPIKIIGRKNLNPISYTLPVPSSQVKSGILLSAINTQGISKIIENSITRDHTEIMLKNFGADIGIENIENNKIITIKGKKELMASNIDIPGDFSSAAFFIVAALLIDGSYLVLKNINLNPTRIGLLKALLKMGADIGIKNKNTNNGECIGDIIIKHSKLKGCTLDSNIATTMIDEYPIISVAAAYASNSSKFCGLKELTMKESNRLLAISENLLKCGVNTIIEGDNLVIHPLKKNVENIVEISSKKDHRIAMSFTIMGMLSKKGFVINNAEYINTSFPNFIDKINRIGAKIS